jgi:phage-related minor tail protein
MGFLNFLGGAVKILLGGGLFVFSLLGVPTLFIQGQTVAAAVLAVVGLVGGLYAQYERGQQSSRVG